MIAVTMTPAPRASAAVGADLAERRAFSAALSERLASVNADLHTARAARARAIAEGKPAPKASEIATLAEDGDGITAALALIAERVTTLQAEETTAQLAEAETAQAAAIAEASEKIAALDAALRQAVVSIVAPASDTFNAALTAARRADDDLDRLKRKASAEPLPDVRGKAERVIDRRSRLLALVEDLRKYAAEPGAA